MPCKLYWLSMQAANISAGSTETSKSSYLVSQSTCPVTSPSPRKHFPPTVTNDQDSIHRKIEQESEKLSTGNYLQDLHISTAYLKRRHRSLLALKKDRPRSSNRIRSWGLQSRKEAPRIVWIHPHDLESRPSMYRAPRDRFRSHRGGAPTW